jgi:hypothetical protein
MTGPRAILLIEKNVDPAREEEFNRWYTQDHMPSLLSCPGFVRGRRYESSPIYYPASLAVDPRRTGRKYVQLYELDSIEALNTPEYQDIAFTNPTGWTRRMRSENVMSDIIRDIYVEIAEPTAASWIGRQRAQ